MKTVIGLAGVKTSGKSTVTKIIQGLIPSFSPKESALADKLKNTCAEVFGISRKCFDEQSLKEIPFELFGMSKTLRAEDIKKILSAFNVEMSKTEFTSKYKDIVGMELLSARHIAQIVGTEVLRAAGDIDIHCKNMPLNEDGVTIVSDLRFPNEFDYFMRNSDIKFVPIYIQREEAEKHVTKDSHPSETSVFLFSDKCIPLNNNGSLEETKEQVERIIENSRKGGLL